MKLVSESVVCSSYSEKVKTDKGSIY